MCRGVQMAYAKILQWIMGQLEKEMENVRQHGMWADHSLLESNQCSRYRVGSSLQG